MNEFGDDGARKHHDTFDRTTPLDYLIEASVFATLLAAATLPFLLLGASLGDFTGQ